MARNEQMTIEQAKATAERMERQQESWDAQADQQAWDTRVASRFLGGLASSRPTAIVTINAASK